MDEWVDNLGPAEGAKSLVREKEEFNIDEQVQSQRGQSLLQMLLVARRRSDLKRKVSFLGAPSQKASQEAALQWVAEGHMGRCHREEGKVQNSPLGDQYNRAAWRELFVSSFPSLRFLSPTFSQFPLFFFLS